MFFVGFVGNVGKKNRGFEQKEENLKKKRMYKQLKDYFHHLADKHVMIQEHVGYFSREIIEKQSSFAGITSPFLAIYDYELGLDGGELNTLGRRKLVFSIVFADAPHDDFEGQQEKIDQAERIALQLLARIRWDSHQRNHFLYGAFEKDLTRIFPIEEPQAHLYGVDVEVHFKTKAPLVVNPADWEDTFLTC